MKKITLSILMAFAALTYQTATAQCVANGTMVPTGNPGEFTITDLSTVSATSSSYFAGGDGGMLYLQPFTSVGTYQYTANGTYNYYFAVQDSGSVFCMDTMAGTVVVTGITTTPVNCQASFLLQQDSLNQNTYWCWNTSTGTSPSSALTYFWSFGDGSSSTSAYPTHTYSGIGVYTLCLTISEPNNCTSTFCDTIVITVKASGTTLNVLPAGAGLKLEELNNIQSLVAFPNPTEDEFTLEMASNNATSVEVTIMNIAGEKVYTNAYSVQSGINSIQLQTAGLSKGVYLVKVSDALVGSEKTIRVVKK